MVILRYLGVAVAVIIGIHLLDLLLRPLLYPLIALAVLIGVLLVALGESSFFDRRK